MLCYGGQSQAGAYQCCQAIFGAGQPQCQNAVCYLHSTISERQPVYCRRITLILACILMAGCASGPLRLQARLQSIPETQRGYVAGRFEVSCIPQGNQCREMFSIVEAVYRMAKDSPLYNALSWKWAGLTGYDTTPDYVNNEEGQKGFHFCVQLPPAEYEFYSVLYYSSTLRGGITYSLRDTEHFSVPFVVRAAEVVDIGTIRMEGKTETNFLGLKRHAPGIMLLSEHTSAETNAALSKCPEAARHLPVAQRFLAVPQGRETPFVGRLQTSEQTGGARPPPSN